MDENKRFCVTVANIFYAETPEDAVLQMAEWLAENARFAGYRVECEDGSNRFIDAEKVYSGPYTGPS